MAVDRHEEPHSVDSSGAGNGDLLAVGVPTLFAAPERFTRERVLKQHERICADAFLTASLDAVQEMVLVVNSCRQAVYANRRVLEFLGLEQQNALLGMRPGELFRCVHSTLCAAGCGTTEFCRHCGAVNAMLESLQGRASLRECRLRSLEGALDLEVRATPLKLDGEQLSFFAIRDVSAEKRRRALERIFFHDIINSASGVQGLASMIREVEPDQVDEYQEMLINASNDLLEEIHCQRDLTAAEQGELQVRAEGVDCWKLLDEVLRLYAGQRKRIQREILSDSIQAGECVIASDARLLRRVLSNMVRNALEASSEGDVVRVGCFRTKRHVRFEVRNPAFMPREVQLQVFARSFSTKGRNRGLGTYSMKLLSEAYLGGTVDFTSTVEDGTTFFAEYPLD